MTWARGAAMAEQGEQKCRRGAAADVGVATGELLVHPDGIARPDW